MDAGDVNDHPASLRHHPLEGLLGAYERPEQIDADDLKSGDRVGVPAQGVHAVNARVVDQDVEAAVAGVDLLEHGGHLRWATHVGQHRERLAADFQYSGGAGGLNFRAPGCSADVQFGQSGKYPVNVDAQGALAVANDFYRGRDMGGAWNWVINVSGVFLIVVALTGLGIMLSLKEVRTASLISIVVGRLMMGRLMWRAM